MLTNMSLLVILILSSLGLFGKAMEKNSVGFALIAVIVAFIAYRFGKLAKFWD